MRTNDETRPVTMIESRIRERLFAMRDLGYRDFQAKLMPTVDKETIIGVRTPALRALAKECATEDMRAFLTALPHAYYEENNLHGFLIERMKEYAQVIASLDAFLPYVDNWATCDLITPKVFKKHLQELDAQIEIWLRSAHAFTLRFGIEMRMCFFLDDAFDARQLHDVAQLRYPEDAKDSYYVRMMVAWYFATALAKQYAWAIPYIENNALEEWTHKKTIQKAIESYRITDAQKAYLRSLRDR